MKRKFIINKSFSINSADEFRDYAHNLMKNAHGDDYSEEVTNKVVDDLLDNNPGADYGELIGRLTSGFSNDESYAVYTDSTCKELMHKGTQDDCQDWIDDNIDSVLRNYPNYVIEKVENKSFSSEYLDQLKKGLNDRKKYYDDLKKSLKGSTSEFDKTRLELASNSVLEAELYIKKQEVKDKYESELANIDNQLSKLRLQWQELHKKVAEAK